MSAALDPELEAGLRWLRLRGMRELAPELLQTAKTQRWAPHELLATLVREEIASREASNERARLKKAVAQLSGCSRVCSTSASLRRSRWYWRFCSGVRL